MIQPVVLSTVRYPGVRRWQRRGAKPRRQCDPMRKTREGIPMLQASCGRGLTSGSMENGCERLVNLVNDDRRKMLRRLNQNGRWSGYGVRLSPYTVIVPPGKRLLLPFQGHLAERGKPHLLLSGRSGNLTVRKGERRGGMGWWRTRMPPGNRADRGSSFVPT